MLEFLVKATDITVYKFTWERKSEIVNETHT